MNFKTDIPLKHSVWEDGMILIDKSGLSIFKRYVDIFIIACSLGVAEDKREPDNLSDKDSKYSLPRVTININEDVNSALEFIFQNAILNTKTVDLDSDRRKELAFNYDEKAGDFNINKFLCEFANYGMIMLAKVIENHEIQTLRNIEELIKNHIDCIVPPDELEESELENEEL